MEIKVTFNEAIEQISAENENNYRILQGIDILSANLHTGSSVLLTTGEHHQGLWYTLFVNDVKDNSNQSNSIASYSHSQYLYPDGEQGDETPPFAPVGVSASW
jgi:hypothetical protein